MAFGPAFCSAISPSGERFLSEYLLLQLPRFLHTSTSPILNSPSLHSTRITHQLRCIIHHLSISQYEFKMAEVQLNSFGTLFSLKGKVAVVTGGSRGLGLNAASA